MDRKTKTEIRKRVIKCYKKVMPELYADYSCKYTSNEIRLEVLKALQNHIMAKTTDALKSKLRRKKLRRIENSTEVIAEQDKKWKKSESNLLAELCH